MSCLKCGAEISYNAAFCGTCGSKVEEIKSTNFCFQCGTQNENNVNFCGSCGANLLNKSNALSNNSMTFGKSISTCFKKYFDFKGRASRAEYWWFILFGVLMEVPFQIARVILENNESLTLIVGIMYLLFNLSMIIPTTAVATRRLHDTDHKGWWQLISLTVIGCFYLLYLFVKKGDTKENRYGNVEL